MIVLSPQQTQEIISTSKSFSRRGEQGHTPLWQWDLLVEEKNFSSQMKKFEEIAAHIDTVRVQDIGVAHYLKRHFPHLRLHLILEHTAHNLTALKAYEDFFGDSLTRLVLSLEIKKSSLLDYAQTLRTPLEILAAGKILLFYTPRPLLDANPETEVTRLARSEESVHKNFLLTQNVSGTFMEHPKDFFILEDAEELQRHGIFLRFDIDHIPDEQLCTDLLALKSPASDLRTRYEKYAPTTKGLFHQNKSDVLFKKLKNVHLQENEAIAEVVESCPPHHLLLRMKTPDSLALGETLTFKTPEGKIKTVPLTSLTPLTPDSSEYQLMNYARGIPAKSLLIHQLDINSL